MRYLPIAVTLCGATLFATSAFAQNLSERLQGVAEMRRQQAARELSATSKPALLGALLYTDITADFNETPARDVINYIQAQIGAEIVGRYSDDRGAIAGIDPDTPITLKAEGVPALTVLEQVLDQCSGYEACTWQLRDGFIEVGTKERLDSPAARELRMYSIRDLLFEPTHFDNAPEFDLNAAIQQGNNGGTGGGGMGGGGFGGGGGGFGGGGGGFGGGGSGSGGGGSGIFGDPGEEPDRVSEQERAEQIMEIIRESVETDRWVDNGGNSATMRYFQGVLIIRAPDYIQREIGGYPFAPRPVRRVAGGPRYVSFSAPFSVIQNVGFGSTTVSGAAGGNGP